MKNLFNKWQSIIKLFWFIGISGFVLSGMYLPLLPKVILVFALLATGIIFEFSEFGRRDERQLQISRSSSHAAYWVYTLLTAFVIFREWNKNGNPPEIIYFVLLLAPLIAKTLTSIALGYGSVGSARNWLLVFFRGLIPSKMVDERQKHIGDLSSHIAFYSFLSIASVYIVFYKTGHVGEIWMLLMIVPLIAKTAASLKGNFGPGGAARIFLYGICVFWFLFVILSHGLSLSALIEIIPFLIIVSLVFLSKKFPLLMGIFLVIVGVGLFFFFGGWKNFDVYTRLLMYSLIPLPLLLSGMGLFSEWMGKRVEKAAGSD